MSWYNCVIIVSLMCGLLSCSEVRPYRLEPGELFPDGKPVASGHPHGQGILNAGSGQFLHGDAKQTPGMLRGLYARGAWRHLRGRHHLYQGFGGHRRRHQGNTFCGDRQTKGTLTKIV